MNIETRQAYSEVNRFLQIIDKDLANNIPRKLRDFFERERDVSYIPIIDINKPIKEQKLKRETIVIISVLNIHYWCKDIEKKEKLLEIYINNEKINQKKLLEKYSLDNVFKSKIITENITVPVEIKKETIFKKIINFIKGLFNIE